MHSQLPLGLVVGSGYTYLVPAFLVHSLWLAHHILVILQAGSQAGQYGPWLDWLAEVPLAGASVVHGAVKGIPWLAGCFGLVAGQPDLLCPPHRPVGAPAYPEA